MNFRSLDPSSIDPGVIEVLSWEGMNVLISFSSLLQTKTHLKSCSFSLADLRQAKLKQILPKQVVNCLKNSLNLILHITL